MRLSELAPHLTLRVIRDGSFRSLGFVTHRRPELLAFLGDEGFLPALIENDAITCVLTNEDLVDRVPHALGVAVVDDPKLGFYQLHHSLLLNTDFYGRSEPTRISATARIHDSAVIAPMDVQVGDDVEIGPHAIVLPGVHIGNGCVIRAGSVLGSEGFQVLLTGGTTMRVLHAGKVLIGNRVDIHSNTCVDRSVFAETVIGDDTTIDNLVHVAHDVIIGRHCRIVAHAMIGGSARIGDHAWIGPSASISSEVTVGAGAYITLGSVVTRDVEPGTRVTGNFAIDHDRYLAFLRTIR